MSTRDYLGQTESLRSRSIVPTVRSTTEYKSPRTSSKPARKSREQSIKTVGLVAKLRNRPRLYITIISIIFIISFVFLTLQDTIALARFKLRDRAYEEGWIKGCGFRKRPLLFVRDSNSLVVVWESNCESSFDLHYALTTEHPKSRKNWRKEVPVVGSWITAKVKRIELAGERYVYLASLTLLQGDRRYIYEISEKSLITPATVLVRHSFPWLGSSDRATIHIAAVADNQYNARTFHRILITLLSYAKSLPNSPRPALLIHAGDVVQTPTDLQQWQTDFYEPLTSLLPFAFGQTTPMLLARGNHDWDATGLNAYTGGSVPRADWLAHRSLQPRNQHPGVYFAYSPHARCRIITLDSNLVDPSDLLEQEEWLIWQLTQPSWTTATLKIVIVHVPAFLEYWNVDAWRNGKESEWSWFVRDRLTPILSEAGVTLVLSGHSHVYNRGFLPATLHKSFSSSANSSTLPPLATAVASERSWEKARTEEGAIELDGTVYTTFGGAGGSFDIDRVEDWKFYEKTVLGVHHFGWMTLEMGAERRKVDEKVRNYRFKGFGCGQDQKRVYDELEWSAIDIRGVELDRYRIEVPTCVDVNLTS